MHQLIPMGYLIGGPKSSCFVHEAKHIEPKIKELSEAEGFDSDDYTATQLYAVGWRGSIESMPN